MGLFYNLIFMKIKSRVSFLFLLLIFLSLHSQAQGVSEKKPFEGPRWRVGLNLQYASNFKNIQIAYSSLGYTGLLGGFSGRGLEIFGGYMLHRYIAIDVAAGALLNSYTQNFSGGAYLLGRFNKIYIHPSIKFVYPVIEGGFGTINGFIGGGLGLNGSGKLYLEENDTYTRYITYARYDPMVAPFATLGAELLFSSRSNIVIGFKYQNGTFTAKDYYESYSNATLKTAPAEFKQVSAQGLAVMIGFIQEF